MFRQELFSKKSQFLSKSEQVWWGMINQKKYKK